MTYKKRFEGVKATDELKELLRIAQKLAQQQQQQNDDDDNMNTFNDILITATTDSTNNTDETSKKSLYPSLTTEQATNILQELTIDDNDNNELILSVNVLRAVDIFLKKQNNNDNDDKLSNALRATTLAYTKPPNDDELTDEQKKFRQRMERLRFQNEQIKYTKLTKNLGTYTSNSTDDGITTKSMTYAASIGLNMIVAPISFGVFMYFFGGSLLDYLFPRNITTTNSSHHHNTTTDIRKVIIGVVSGVAMLFIEMLLFVIRTNEMDKAIRKKQRKQQNNNIIKPFGYYTSQTSKTYTDKTK